MASAGVIEHMRKNANLHIALLVSALVVISVIIANYNRLGTGDFYYHASVINELNYEMMHPLHPSYGSADTTQYFTPYHFILSIFSRATGLDAVDSMHVMAVVNALLFLFTLYLFTRSNYGYFSAFSMLFVLFLWGGVWGFSGEYAFRIIASVAAYHSMFSLWIMLLTFHVALKANKYNFVLLPMLSVIGILSQPITIFATPLGVCIMLLKHKKSYKKWITMSIFYVIIVVALIILWPYYPVLKIQQSSSSPMLSAWPGIVFPMYDPMKILKVVWPLLLVSPFLIVAKLKENSYLLLLSLGLLVPYLALSWTQSELIGRNLPYIVLFLLIAAAHSFETAFRRNPKHLLMLIVLVPIIAYNILMGAYKYRKRDESFLRELKEELVVIAPLIGHYDVVITDLNTGYYMVAYSGKIVATIFPQKFVKDNQQRAEAIAVFYDPETENVTRQKIISRYDAKYILQNKKKERIERSHLFRNVDPAVQDSLRSLGDTVLDLKQLRLIKVQSLD